jgi:cell wall-associated NlpC family hydrolase
VYKINGVKLSRDAHQQANQGQTLSFIEESEAGDLAFFDDSEGKIVHVGLLLENHCIIHAHGTVRIDQIDQTGIYNGSTHTHKLRMIKKLI